MTDCDNVIAAMLGFEPGPASCGYAGRFRTHWEADHGLLNAVVACVGDAGNAPASFFDIPMRRFGMVVRGG